MEVRKGYKQTDVGVIPEDWNVKPLDTISFVTSGKRLPLGKTLTDDETSHPYIRVTDMRMGTVDLSDIKYVPEEVFPAIKRYRIYKEDIFISVAGTLGIIGKIPQELDGANLTENADRITNITCSQDYLLHILMSPLIQNTIDSLQTVGAQPKLALTRIRKFDIPIPPTLAEQEAIAEALSDADALIESLETLLAKKRQVKQGAMSELLTGKRRVSGFNKKWENKKLSEIFEITAGGDFDPSQSSSIQDEHHPYPIYSNAVTDQGLYGFSSYNVHQAGSITVTARGTLGVTNYRNHDFTAIGRVIVLKATQPLDGRFVSEFINNRIEFVVESTGVPQLTAPQISKYEILFPEFPEQNAIAEILSDMDEEIRAVEGKLSKARGVKAGMMSALLGGRVRLV